jgi:hypothetical protein
MFETCKKSVRTVSVSIAVVLCATGCEMKTAPASGLQPPDFYTDYDGSAVSCSWLSADLPDLYIEQAPGVQEVYFRGEGGEKVYLGIYGWVETDEDGNWFVRPDWWLSTSRACAEHFGRPS